MQATKLETSRKAVPMKEPEGFSLWNPAMRGSYRKGYDAALAGKRASACPYEDKRKDCGRITWSRAFRAAWHDGWNDARQHDPVTAYYADRANSGLAALAQ